ncbi:MAG: hypothetical protein ACI9KN_002171, partial [Gammaproteobacteria bacterium]
EKLSFEVSLRKSLLSQSLVFQEVNAQVDTLNIRKDKNHQWWLSDIALGEPGLSGNAEDNIAFDMAHIFGLTPNFIHIDIKQITIDDEVSNQQHTINNTQFELQRRRGKVHARLDSNLQSLGGQIGFQAIFSKQRSIVYSKFSRLNPQLATLFDLNIDGLQQADLSGDLWFSFGGDKPASVQADLSLSNGQFQPSQTELPLVFSFDTRLSVQQKSQDWTIVGQFDQMLLDSESMPGFDTQLSLTLNDGETKISGWVPRFDLSALTLLDDRLLPGDIGEKIKRSNLKGELQNIWFNLNPHNLGDLALSAKVINLATSPVSGIPGINRLSGSLILGRHNLQFESSGDKLALDFENEFRAPIEIDRYSLQTNASFDDKGLRISVPKVEISNPDIKLAARLLLNFDHANSPMLYLRANFDKGVAANVSKYLPVQLLPKFALSWLDDGIKAADISDGNLLYHGRLQHLRKLSKESSGEFYVDFKVNNGELMFHPEWDSVRQAQGIVSFHNLGMTADISSASFGLADRGIGQVSIADFYELTIDMDLEARTEASKALPTWLNMPISTGFRQVAKNFKNVDGEVTAKIKIELPLGSESLNTEVDVDLEFNNAAVDAPGWEVALRNINGTLQVTQDQISAKGITANYFGDPIVVGVETDNINNKTIIQSNGVIDTRQLMRLLPEYMSSQVSGKSDWQVQLLIDNLQNDVAEPLLGIKAQSDLKNTRVNFPAPLTKTAELSRKTSVAVSVFANDTIDFGVRYGSHILTRGHLAADENRGDFELNSMDVGLSTSLRPRDLNPGVRLYGATPKLSVDDWLDWYQTEVGYDKTAANPDSTDSGWNLIESVDVQVQSASVQGRQWTGVDFKLRQQASEFSGEVESSHLTGKFVIPKQQSIQNPIVADMALVKLETVESSGPASTLLPGDLYNLKLNSKAFFYNDYEFENLHLEVLLDNNALFVNKMELRRDDVILQGNGTWQYEPTTKTHASRFDFTIDGPRFGQTMAAIGFGDAIGGGNIDFDAQLSWPDSLLNFGWDQLTGKANIIIDNGVLKDVEPGSGRLIGLLSLNALPRRLLFGFGDVIGNGMEFDQIAGTYTIDGENLYTNNTHMDGPAAKVLITGTTGLRSQNYDQKMVITPKVRQTLPLIGGIALGSTVGWGLLLVEKLFKDGIDKTVEIEYTITGSWDDPKIVLVSQPKIDRAIIKNDK